MALVWEVTVGSMMESLALSDPPKIKAEKWITLRLSPYKVKLQNRSKRIPPPCIALERRPYSGSTVEAPPGVGDSSLSYKHLE